MRVNYKKITSVIFAAFLIVSFVFSFAKSPKQIIGGLARGYIDSDKGTSVLSKIGNGFNKFDSRLSEYYIFHDESIHLFGFIQKIMCKSLINDTDKSYEVLKLKNGYLTFKDTGDSDYSELEKYLINLKSVCASQNTDLLYVNKVSKSAKDENLAPDNYPYIYDSNYEEFKNNIISENIDVLDIDENFKQNNIDKYPLFFVTDHHWKPQAGILVSRMICEEINKDFDYKIETDIFAENMYKTETFEKCFLGSQGKRVGLAYAGIDDFDIITPKGNTKYQLEIPSENLVLNGTFEDVMIHRESITPDNLLNKDDTAYDTYMRGNHPLVKIENLNNQNGKKALIILDSYGCVVAPYLSQAFSTLDCIDIRSFDTSVIDYVKDTKPDVVIYMISNNQ